MIANKGSLDTHLVRGIHNGAEAQCGGKAKKVGQNFASPNWTMDRSDGCRVRLSKTKPLQVILRERVVKMPHAFAYAPLLFVDHSHAAYA